MKSTSQKILVHTLCISFLFFGVLLNKPKKITTRRPAKEIDATALINSPDWLNVQQKAKDTVVQLFVHTSEFNWKQPYKTPSQDKAWGTGFFIDDKGHLISNYHVVEEAASIKIQIPSLGKKQLDVTIIGSCPARDITLLKLTKQAYETITEKLKRIPFLPLGNSDTIKRTHQVLALGYPLGQEKLKSTQGIVSGRENISEESYIQITAAINDGSSGGPSLNTSGKVIGINTAAISRAQSIGYIIPINDVKSAIKDLHKERYLRKPFPGCMVNKGNEELVEFLNNPKPGGMYVARVFKNTLFDEAGFKAGDMIYSINGKQFDLYVETQVKWSEDKVHLSALLNRFTLGEKISIDFYRKGIKKTASFNFDLRPPLLIRTMYPEYEKIDYEVIGGMVIMQLSLNHISIFDEINPHLTKYTKRENRYVPRLVVTHVLPNSQAQQARVISQSDVIEQVNGQDVKTLDDLRLAVKKNKNFLSVQTEEKSFMVMSMEKIIKQEDELSKRYFYKKSHLIKELKQ